MNDELFDEDFQLYEAWYMNIIEFTDWLNNKIHTLGFEEFNTKYPRFQSTYEEYLKIIKGEE